MKKDQKLELRNMKDGELQKKLQELAKDLANQKLQFSMGKIKNVHQLKALKKQRAIIKTILTERTLEAK